MDLEDNPGLRAELEAARAWGVPWRRWAGWEPTEVTTYEYDEVGRVTRKTVTRDPLWNEMDREAALALATYEASVCSGCGQHYSIALDPETEFLWEGQILAQCHACKAVGIKREQLEKEEHPYLGAQMIGPVLRD